jgi:putative transcriptional regulator
MWLKRVLILLCLTQGNTQAAESVREGSLNRLSDGRSLPTANLQAPRPGVFLVAQRGLTDPRFRQSVVYLVTHGHGGSLGLIVNRPGDISLADAVPDFAAEQAAKHALYFGGPVGLPMILMLMHSESVPEGMEHIADDVYVSSEQPLLEEALVATQSTQMLRFYIGYSGWGAGQLDFELAHDGWHVVAADIDAIFSNEPDSLWPRLIEQLEPSGIQAENQSPLSLLATAQNSTGQRGRGGPNPGFTE